MQFSSILSALALSMGAAQAEEPQPAEPSDEILVTAPTKQGTIERRRELRKMAASVMRPARSGHTVATFFKAICPMVAGLPQNAADVIEARMAENARRLGVNRRTPSADCRHNVSVVFIAPAGGKAITWLNDESRSLRHLLSFQRNRILADPDPVRAWNSTFPRSSDGGQIPDLNGRSLADAAEYSNRLRHASRLRSPVTFEIAAAVVMIELEAANGKTLGQLADYASMRVFADTRPIDPNATPAAATILTLFQDDEAPEELTAFDRALISKIYSTSRNATENRYYSNIAARAVKLEQEEASSVGD